VSFPIVFLAFLGAIEGTLAFCTSFELTLLERSIDT